MEFKMVCRVILARIHRRSTFSFLWKTIGFIFCSIANPTSKQEVAPLKSEVGTCLGAALWAKMLYVPVVDVGNLALAVRALSAKHMYMRFLYFPVPVLFLGTGAFQFSVCGQ